MSRVIAISGSLRRHSSNTTLLRALTSVAPADVEIVLYDGLGTLPHFNPDLDEEDAQVPPTVGDLRTLLIGADAIVISSPEYAHGVPGTLKNMLDWLVSTGELVDKPVVLLNASPSGGEYAQGALLETLRTMNWKVLESASRISPFVRQKIRDEVTDEETLGELRQVIAALPLEASRMRPLHAESGSKPAKPA
jgi:chromate reductase